MVSLPRDPVIEEIREIRHQISARFGHDPERLFEHYMRLQEEYRDRLLDAPKGDDRRQILEKIQKKLDTETSPRLSADPADLIREDRDR